MWFVGAHSNIGGGYKHDKDSSSSILSDNALAWISNEARKSGLTIETHLDHSINNNPLATLHNFRRSFYRIKKKYYRPIKHGKGSALIHKSVKLRWDQDSKYRPRNLDKYVKKNG
jgi:uncharacterized protein (DUF2235 family)